MTSPYVEVRSYIRGIHTYDKNWKPKVGDILQLRREPDSCKDKFTVVVCKKTGSRGTYLIISLTYSLRFCKETLARVWQKSLVKVCVNRGVGYRLEVPCNFRLFGIEGVCRASPAAL